MSQRNAQDHGALHKLDPSPHHARMSERGAQDLPGVQHQLDPSPQRMSEAGAHHLRGVQHQLSPSQHQAHMSECNAQDPRATQHQLRASCEPQPSSEHGAHAFHGVASVVVLDGRVQPDVNGFVTALAARALRRSGKAVPAPWLDTLQRCARDDGAYGFWPVHETPAWAPVLPSDADDTAVMLLELLRAGRVTRAQATRTAIRSLARHRVTRFPEPGPAWRRRGAFRTWHRAGLDLVDCTVNANVLALLGALDLLHLPGVKQSLEMLSAAVDWAADLPLRAASLSPFYPKPCELIGALDHAVECGARVLAGVLHKARATSWACAEVPDKVVCSSPYGAVKWYSPALWEIRAACRRF